MARKWRWSRRAGHSINTPRCLLRLHPQKPSVHPYHAGPVSSLSLSLFLSHSLFYPPATPLHRGRRVRSPLGRGTYGGNGLSAGRRLGKEILRSAEFFDTRSSWTMQKKKKIKKDPIIRENLSAALFREILHSDFSRNREGVNSSRIKCNARGC